MTKTRNKAELTRQSTGLYVIRVVFDHSPIPVWLERGYRATIWLEGAATFDSRARAEWFVIRGRVRLAIRRDTRLEIVKLF